MVWNISSGQLVCLSGCAPSQLLHTCSSAEYEKVEKVLYSLATAENISAINILLILNPKHGSYWEENSLYLCETRTDQKTGFQESAILKREKLKYIISKYTIWILSGIEVICDAREKKKETKIFSSHSCYFK